MYYLSFLECITEQSNWPLQFCIVISKITLSVPLSSNSIFVWPLVLVKFEMKAYPGNNYLS